MEKSHSVSVSQRQPTSSGAQQSLEQEAAILTSQLQPNGHIQTHHYAIPSNTVSRPSSATAASSQTIPVNHPILPTSNTQSPSPSFTALDSLPAEDNSINSKSAKVSTVITESQSPTLHLQTIYSRPPTISSHDANSAAQAVFESHDTASVKESSKQSVAPPLSPAGETTSRVARLASTAQLNFSDRSPTRHPARSLGSSLQSQEGKMVRVGIRWQLAALVVISSLIGLAVISIATWVCLDSLCNMLRLEADHFRSRITISFFRLRANN
jgi:hypothetical protein